MTITPVFVGDDAHIVPRADEGISPYKDEGCEMF